MLFSQYLPSYDEVGRVICLIVSATYAAYPFMQFGIVYNRVIALFLPFKFDKLCPIQAAWIFVTLGLLYAAFFVAHQLAHGCRFAYDAKTLNWQYLNCPYEDRKYFYIFPVLIMTAAVLILNSVVAFQLMIKKLKATTSCLYEKKNRRMFWQGFVQDVFNANDLIWQCFLSGLINSPIWVFIADTLVWELSPICDG
ncbi:unnamed protein product [Cylicocyclus nassatus]|uniref:7TM GPCR serpentine receptor class x (Srx) domain-containing protein n=1 Tax=Cylicocyclus nassatus TaxID=53992 RepID=A0AA36DLI2_CYLNA|nr:unnamed protein product [Cylicocyclus nassatus]